MSQRAHNLRDLVGLKFGRLEVVQRTRNNKNKHALWICKCDCGGSKVVSTTSLRKGLTSS